MSVGPGSICFACARWEGDTCESFPEGIPSSITNGADHRQPVGGERTGPDGEPLLFELAPEPEAAEDLETYERMKASGAIA